MYRRSGFSAVSLVAATSLAMVACTATGHAGNCRSTPDHLLNSARNSPTISAVPRGASTTSRQSTTRPAQTSATTKPAVTKVIVFVVENHSLAQMKAGMPKVYGFAKKYAYASDYHAITHPSLPNYVAITAGSTLGISDDKGPDAHQLTANNVFHQALQHHKRVKLYADSMPSRCYLHNEGNYAVRHNPWAYYVNDRRACNSYDVPATQIAGDVNTGRLPNIGFVIPNLVHDAHNGTLAQSDEWICQKINLLRSGPDWASGHLAIVITADEDDGHHHNRVLTVVGSRYQTHKVVTRYLNHYSLTKLLEQVAGAHYLRQANGAPDMRSPFQIRIAS